MGHPLLQNPATDSVILVLVAVLLLVLLLLRLLLLLLRLHLLQLLLRMDLVRRSPSHVLCIKFKQSRKAES